MEQKKYSVMFYEICRLCLEEKGYCDIFDKDNLYDNINLFTGIKMSLSDDLPQKICIKCLDIVNKVAELRTLARKNDAHLKSLFGGTQNKTPESSSKDAPETATVVSSHFERDKDDCDSPSNNSAIASFISVRKDLFDSSVTEDSIMSEPPQADSSEDQTFTRKVSDDGTIQFSCNKCSKKFNVWKKYYLHSRSHNKNYGCPLDACSKKFATKNDLEKHIRTHTGEKPYKCTSCDKSFAQRGTLKSHIEAVHVEMKSTRDGASVA